MNGMIRGAVFDLDDTLLRDDLSISPYTVDVFHRLSQAGFRLIAASGRAKMSMLPYVERLGCVDLYISCNGAELWDPKADRLLHQETFSAELGRRIADFGESRGVYAQTYEGDSFYFNYPCVYADRYARTSLLKGVCVGDLRVFIREPRTKILMMAEESQIAAMLTEARELFRGEASVTCSKPWFLEFNPPGATKGLALGQAAETLGLDAGSFVAFGDSLNDLPMLEAAGRAVTVANGWPQLREVCHDVCLSNQEDGVARYLAEHFLSGEAKV